MFRLDYLSCLLTVVATILVGRKMWTGLVVSGVNSLIVCVIGLHTSQYGFIPANVFCICMNAISLRTWLKAQKHSSEPTADESSELPAGGGPHTSIAAHAHERWAAPLLTQCALAFPEREVSVTSSTGWNAILSSRCRSSRDDRRMLRRAKK